MNHQAAVTRQQQKERDADESKKQGAPQTKQEKTDITPASSVSKIRTRLSTGTLFMNGTSTFKEKDMKQLPSTSESSKLQKETGTSGVKRKSSTPFSSADTAIPTIPPKRRKIGQNDGSGEDNKNDYFCWFCHKDECNAFCRVCPRIYHLKCLGVSSLPKEWVCPECEKIMRAECVETRSKAMSRISLDTLCLLLRYALERMQQPGSEVFLKPVDESVVPAYRDYVFNPMDFVTLEKNIKERQYGCTEAFLADARWILHNCIVFNGLHHKMTNVARNIIKSCKHEMSEIEVCPECYQNSCLKSDGNWFVEPCHPPHTLVWAKLKGYPFWPAKALREVNGQVDVRFFGAHDRSWVLASQVFLLSRDSPTPIKNRKGGFAGAMKELEVHIKKIKEIFGGFEYAPRSTPYSQRHLYMKYNIKGVKVMHRFKVASRTKASKTDAVSTDRISVASKAASALISKYNSLNSRKSNLAGPQSYAGLAGLQPVRDKCAKIAVSPRAKTKTLRSVTDIIEEKIKQQKELEEKEQEDGEYRVEEENSNSDQDCADGVGERCSVSVGKICTVSGQTASINSDNTHKNSEETSYQSKVLCEETTETNTQMKGGEIASEACDLPVDVDQEKLDESSTRHSLEKHASLEREESSKTVSLVLSSGVDYKSALTKVIETCKDKLGIKNVEDLEENIDDIDADEEGDGSEENKPSERKNNKPDEPGVDVMQSMQKPQESSAEVVVEKERLPECESGESSDAAKSFTFLKPVTVSRTSVEGIETEKQAANDPRAETLSNKNVSVEINVGDKVCEKSTLENKEVTDKGPETSQKVDGSGKAVPSVMKSVNAPTTTDKGIKPVNSDNANTNIKPITIDDDSSDDKGEDSNEPSLLMEVESEPEQELENDQLIIDLEEDDLELREDKTMKKNMPPSEKSKSVSIVKELSPSPMLRKAVQTPDEKSWPCQNERCMQKQSSNFILPSSSYLVLSKPSTMGQNSNRETSSRSGQPMQLPAEESNGPAVLVTDSMTSQSHGSLTKSAAAAKSASSLADSSSRQQDETSLTPAAVRLVNQYSSQLMGNLQQQLAHMCKEVIAVAVPEQEKSRCYQQEIDRLKWIHQQEIAEIKHNYKLSIAEMRNLWESEKGKSLGDLKRKLTKEKEEAVVAAKKKQWCANCLKEAIYYCCWNTSYCSYDCQQTHWPTHLPSCMQTQSTTGPATATTTSGPKTTGVTPLGAGTSGSGFDSDVIVMSASLGPTKVKGVDNAEKLQKFNLTPPQSTSSLTVQGNETWRNHAGVSHAPVGQNIHFLSTSQAVSSPPYINISSDLLPPLPPPSQPLQQLRYLQSLEVVAASPQITYASQMQLLPSQPVMSNILPSTTVMPTNTMVLPVLHATQPSGSSTSNQNIVISRPIRFQPLWK